MLKEVIAEYAHLSPFRDFVSSDQGIQMRRGVLTMIEGIARVSAD